MLRRRTGRRGCCMRSPRASPPGRRQVGRRRVVFPGRDCRDRACCRPSGWRAFSIRPRPCSLRWGLGVGAVHSGGAAVARRLERRRCRGCPTAARRARSSAARRRRGSTRRPGELGAAHSSAAAGRSLSEDPSFAVAAGQAVVANATHLRNLYQAGCGTRADWWRSAAPVRYRDPRRRAVS